MKVAVLILVIAVTGAFAEPPPFTCTDNAFICKFKELGHNIKYHATKLGGKLADVGMGVLGAAIDTGKDLLVNGSRAVIGTVLDHLNDEGLVGKRALIDEWRAHLAKGYEGLKKIKAGIHAAYKKAVQKLTGVIAKTASLKGIDEATDKKIDEAVEEFKKSGKKGFFNMAKMIAGKISEIFKAGMAKIRAKYGKKDEARAILESVSAAWNKAKESLSNLAGNIADTFKPHLDTLKKGVSDLATKAKETGTKLANAAKDQFDQLKTKLSGHIDTLKGHAKDLGNHAVNSLNALKEAVSSIAAQAVENTKGTVGEIVKTGAGAVGVIADHVAGN